VDQIDELEDLARPGEHSVGKEEENLRYLNERREWLEAEEQSLLSKIQNLNIQLIKVGLSVFFLPSFFFFELFSFSFLLHNNVDFQEWGDFRVTESTQITATEQEDFEKAEELSKALEKIQENRDLQEKEVEFHHLL